MCKAVSKWNTNFLVTNIRTGFMMISKDKMDKVMIVAVTEVPLDSGRLLNTGIVECVANTKNHIRFKASFGGPKGLAGGSAFATRLYEPIKGSGISKKKRSLGVVDYAIRWHENSAYFKHGRKMHYLIDPFMREFSGFKCLEDYGMGIRARI